MYFESFLKCRHAGNRAVSPENLLGILKFVVFPEFIRRISCEISPLQKMVEETFYGFLKKKIPEISLYAPLWY